MGFPYILEPFLPSKLIAITPLWGMMSSQLIKYQVSIGIMVIQGLIFIVGGFIFPKFSYAAFTRENKR